MADRAIVRVAACQRAVLKRDFGEIVDVVIRPAIHVMRKVRVEQNHDAPISGEVCGDALKRFARGPELCDGNRLYAVLAQLTQALKV